MAIDSRAKRYIEDYEVALKKQLSYVKGNTWIKGFANRQQRIQEHDLQYALTSKNLDLLKNYYKVASESLNYKSVKTFLDLLVEFTTIYIERQEEYFLIEDWFEYESHRSGEKTEEMEFQSILLKNVSKMKNDLVTLNLEGNIQELGIVVYGQDKISIPMREKLELKYEIVTEYLEQKREEEYGNNTE